jgi:hypothetical protein
VARISAFLTMLVGALFVVLAIFDSGRASAQPPIEFTTTQFGNPNPVQPGGTVTWFLQGFNQGDEALEDIGWSIISPTGTGCGPQSFPGPFTTGQTTTSATCDTTAPQSGEAVLSVRWTATVVSTGEVLTPITTTVVAVQSEETTTTTTTTTIPTTTTSSTSTSTSTTTTSTTLPTSTTTSDASTTTEPTSAVTSPTSAVTTTTVTAALGASQSDTTEPTTPLAFTGSDPSLPLSTGVGLVLLGGVTLRLSRPPRGAHFRSRR